MDELKLNHSLVSLYRADARYMRPIQDESVQCVVTSPPYFGLRDYAGEEKPIWGGDPECPHEWQTHQKVIQHHKDKALAAYSAEHHRGGATKILRLEDETVTTATCQYCGAWKGTLGQESTVQDYIQHSVEVLRSVRRVLRPDGIVFWNIGDSYAGSGKGIGGTDYSKSKEIYPDYDRTKVDWKAVKLKPKNLCLIPERLAIAVQDDGWWVRSIIIWEKPNAKPESVKDRPTVSHEYLLMLTKTARPYWDYVAGLEAYTEPLNRWGGPEITNETDRMKTYRNDVLGGAGQTSLSRKGRPIRPNELGRNLRTVWSIKTDAFDLEMCLDCRTIYEAKHYQKLKKKNDRRICACGSQNWLSHFAVFPRELPLKCIQVATPEGGCCSECWRPFIRGDKGWTPACTCGAPPKPSLVLDPFAGTGTTLIAARDLGRRAVGLEISEDYCDLIMYRARQGGLI